MILCTLLFSIVSTKAFILLYVEYVVYCVVRLNEWGDLSFFAKRLLKK